MPVCEDPGSCEDVPLDTGRICNVPLILIVTCQYRVLELGPCQDSSTCEPRTAWHYSRTLDTCTAFHYRGCGGNDNRHRSRTSCLRCALRAQSFAATLPLPLGRLLRRQALRRPAPGRREPLPSLFAVGRGRTTASLRRRLVSRGLDLPQRRLHQSLLQCDD